MPNRQADAASFACSHESLELPQAVRDGIREMHQRWDNRLEAEGWKISEEYIGGRLCFLVNLGAESGPDISYPRDTVWSQAKGAILKRKGHVPIWAYELEQRYLPDRDQRRDDRMLFSIVEQVEAVDIPASSAIVTRETDQEFLRIVSRRFYSIARGFISDLAVSGWKGGPAVLCTAIQADQFPKCVIERSSHIVNGVSKHQADGIGDLLLEAEFNGGLSRLRIASKDKKVVVAMHESIKSGLKIVDVMLGPL